MTSQPLALSLSPFLALYQNPRVGDLVIRASDDVEFHVYKAIIAAASPLFTDMISLPQPALQPGEPRKPVIKVTERSAVWATLIMLCYAPRPPTPEDFEDLDAVRAVLDAGPKYQLDVAAEFARLGLLLPKFVMEKPFAVYALACTYRLTDVARAAARQSLRFPIYFDYSPELDLLPLRAYHRLSEYRRECGAVARTLVSFESSGSSWPPSRSPLKEYVYKTLPGGLLRVRGSQSLECKSCFDWVTSPQKIPRYVSNHTHQVLKTSLEYLQSLHTTLQFLPDADLALSEPLLQAIIKPALACPQCVNTIHQRVADFSSALRAGLENMISQVDLVVDE